MNWKEIKNEADLDAINENSVNCPVLIFKHSTRCSISSAALSRLERNWPSKSDFKTYFLDLLVHRNVSDLIAEKYKVVHQSPQALIIKNGECIFNCSHLEIHAENVVKALS
jgi:bacillithiol system protein YtxJ